MPMLMTLRIRLAVCPFHAPLRTRLAKSVIWSSTAWTWSTTFSPSTTIDVPLGARRATCKTARPSVMLILSPRNMASIRARRPDASASWRRRPGVLEPGREGGDGDSGPGEAGQPVLAVAGVGGQRPAEVAVIGQGVQGALGHGVHRERRGERRDIEDVGRAGILGPRARPEEALRAGAGVVDALPAERTEPRTVRRVGPLCDRNAELIAQRVRRRVHDGGVPAADEHRGDGADIGVEADGDPPLDAAQERLGRRQVVLA